MRSMGKKGKGGERGISGASGRREKVGGGEGGGRGGLRRMGLEVWGLMGILGTNGESIAIIRRESHSHNPASIGNAPRYLPNNCSCGGELFGYVGGRLTSTLIAGACSGILRLSIPSSTSPSSHTGKVTSYRILSPGDQIEASKTASAQD